MKRLIICCDGTWQDARSAQVTNVVKISRAILPRASDGAEQTVFYQPGLGTEGGRKLREGALGAGLDREIQDAYRFLVHNFQPGDEIWCFGFSRGAYTARSLIGLIRNVWLLKKAESQRIDDAYHIYRTHWGPDADNAVRFREAYCQPATIRLLGVWDTVGSLGIPLALFDGFNAERYNFHDTQISRIVEHAYHALAIDERRLPFAPTIWQTGAGRTQTEQSWFSGSHGDIGGGHHEGGLADETLQWLINRAQSCGLECDERYLDQLGEQAGKATVHRSDRGAWKLLGREWRSIGATNGDEIVHHSAEQRYLNDSRYRPANLRDYFSHNEQINLPL